MAIPLEGFTAIPMVTFDTSTLTSSFQVLNSGGFAEDIKVMKIYNASDVDVIISYDNGVNPNDIFPALSIQLLDIQANHDTGSAYSSGRLHGRKGQILMGRGIAGTGNFYIIGYR